MKIMKVAMSAAIVALLASASYGNTVVFSGGNLADDANWVGGSKPGAGDTGNIFVDGSINQGNLISALTGDFLVISNGATITGTGDWGHNNVGESIVYNATLTFNDDIFSNGSVMTFNAGSAASANDDFEANGLSIININGGTHSAGDTFGAQGNNGTTFGTVNLLGGTVDAGQFRVASFGIMNLGGSAVLNGNGDTALLDGAINIASDWTGSWTISTLTGTDWATEVAGGDWTLGGTTVDATVFANNFEVSANGQTLSIPEPATLGLVAAFGGSILFIRRKFMI